jgi:hypothetical protein
VIQRLPQRPSRKHLQESIQHLQGLESLSSEGRERMGVAPSLVAEFAKQARTTNAAERKRFTASKRYTLLLSLIQNTQAARTRDAVARMLVHRLATIHKRAIDVLQQECTTAQNGSGHNYLPRLWQQYKNNRAVLSALSMP